MQRSGSFHWTGAVLAVAVVALTGLAGITSAAENVHDGLADPSTVRSGEAVQPHNFSYVVENVSNDGSSDELFVTFPDEVPKENLSSYSGDVTDEGTGESVSISSSISIVDGPDGDGVQETLKIGVQPEGERETRDLVVNFTDGKAEWPTVSTTTDFEMKASVTDSGGPDVTLATFATVTVEAAGSTDADPSVDTASASGVDTSTATLNGELTSLGGADSADVWFAYWQEGARSSTEATTSKQSLSSTGSYSADVSGLDDGVTYVFEAHAEASDGDTVTGSTSRFTTDEEAPSKEVTDGSVDPSTVDGGSKVQHDVAYTVTNASNAGKSVELFVTFPDSVTSDELSSFSAEVSDADTGDAISISSSPSIVDGPDGDGIQESVKVGVQPSGDADYRDLRVTFTGYATWPSVDATTGYPLQAAVLDSEGANLDPPVDVATVTVEASDGSTEPALDVTTGAATGVDRSSATLNGEVTSLGGAESVDVRFTYWREGAKASTSVTTEPQTLTAAGGFQATVSGLEPATTYVFTAHAEASDGDRDEGSQATVTTGEPRPQVWEFYSERAAPDEACVADRCSTMAETGQVAGDRLRMDAGDRRLWIANEPAHEPIDLGTTAWTLRLHCTEQATGRIGVELGGVADPDGSGYRSVDRTTLTTERCEGEDSDVEVELTPREPLQLEAGDRVAVAVDAGPEAVFDLHAKGEAPDTQLVYPRETPDYPDPGAETPYEPTDETEEPDENEGANRTTEGDPAEPPIWSFSTVSQVNASACPVEGCWMMSTAEIDPDGGPRKLDPNQTLTWTAGQAARETYDLQGTNWTLRLHCTEVRAGEIQVKLGSGGPNRSAEPDPVATATLNSEDCEGEDSDLLVDLQVAEDAQLEPAQHPVVAFEARGDASAWIHAKPDAPDTQLVGPASLASYPGDGSRPDAGTEAPLPGLIALVAVAGAAVAVRRRG